MSMSSTRLHSPSSSSDHTSALDTSTSVPATVSKLHLDPAILRDATRLDVADPLRLVRAEFSVPAGVYLCGNSLGPLPRRTAGAVKRHIDKWATGAVDGHFTGPEPWASIEEEAALLSMPVVGARFAHEVAVMNSLTVNLHLMLTAFYRPAGARTRILLEDHAFSSDEYALQTHLHARGLTDTDANLVRLRPRAGEETLRDEDVVRAMCELDDAGTLALVLLPGVQFYTGQVFPMAEVAAECTARGVPFGLDLAHAVGNVPLRLHDWGVDFAVWCNYKYLNSGPGAVAGVFVHDRHARAALPRHAGWWGHDIQSRFRMPQTFRPQLGARGFQLSNPPVLAIVPVTEALRLLKEAGGVERTRAKSIQLTGFLRRCLTARLGKSVDIITPSQVDRCGAQLSIRVKKLCPVSAVAYSAHGKAARVETCSDSSSGSGCARAESNENKMLTDGTTMEIGTASVPKRDRSSPSVEDVNDGLGNCGVVCDVRHPDVIRVAPAPLFNSFMDVCEFVQALEYVLTTHGLLVQ